MQRSDDLVAVKNGHVVFACDGRVPATIAASWYRQIGFPNVLCGRGAAFPYWTASGQALAKSEPPGGPRGLRRRHRGRHARGYDAAKGQVELLTSAALDERRKGPQPPVVIFVDTSREFSNGHVPGARWVPRG